MTWSSLPFSLLAVGLIVWALIAVKAAPRLSGFAQFLFFALSVRYLANFFHEFTARSLVGGQSLNSLITLLICALALYIARRDLIRYSVLLPVYAFMAAIMLSGLWNGETTGLINATIREMLFLGLLVGFVTAVDSELNDGGVSKRLLAIFIAPILYQAFSVSFRIAKASESDGSISYIGGYVHEGVFSVLLLTGMGITALSAGMVWRRRIALLAMFFVALLFANYRTAVVAALPILLASLVFGGASQVRSSFANTVRGIAVLGAMIGGYLIVTLLSQRMADLGAVFNGGIELFKPPSEFDASERGLLSGRVMIWNDYIFSVLRAESSHLFFGFGPDAWQRTFDLYAHNVFVSYLYELGILGVVAFVYMQLHFLVLALMARNDKRWILVSLHISYALLCLGTMPTFTIEGVIFYAMICGYTVYYYLSVRVQQKFVMPINLRNTSALGR